MSASTPFGLCRLEKAGFWRQCRRNLSQFSTLLSVCLKFPCETAGGWTKFQTSCNLPIFFHSRKNHSINTLRENGNRSHITKKCRRSLVSSWEPSAAAHLTVRVYIYYYIYYEMHARIHLSRALKIIIGQRTFLESKPREREKEERIIWMFRSLAGLRLRCSHNNSGVVATEADESVGRRPKVTVRTRQTLI